MGIRDIPTKNNLIKLKAFIKQSKEGRSLLEQKKLILKNELDKYKRKEIELKKNGNKIVEDAYNALNLANVDIGIDEILDISTGVKIDSNIDIRYISIMGVEIPSIVYEEPNIKINYGLYNTTSAVDEAITKFIELKKYLIELAQIENIIYRLNNDIEKVQRRTNALSEIIIPRDEQIAKNIQNILEEAEREEFARLKVMKKKGVRNDV